MMTQVQTDVHNMQFDFSISYERTRLHLPPMKISKAEQLKLESSFVKFPSATPALLCAGEIGWRLLRGCMVDGKRYVVTFRKSHVTESDVFSCS